MQAAGRLNNADWFSDESVKDPSPLPKIPGWFILVRPLAMKTKTKGGIIIPDEVRDDMELLKTCGRVLVVGDEAYAHPDFKHPWVRPGDHVVYDKLVGSRFTYKNVKLLLLQDRHIKMVVQDPEDLI